MFFFITCTRCGRGVVRHLHAAGRIAMSIPVRAEKARCCNVTDIVMNPATFLTELKRRKVGRIGVKSFSSDPSCPRHQQTDNDQY